ncbi:MAG: recombinase RecD [Candidatus Schekmanbacteria bacterium RIFCSPHIGHO2_02_FULL_38_11]|uniref:Recombinase RecD n=1 Tax=Candidatus Schekmanbacteria bacterium RIFCSPLOWO2_12_FULL_38_15 TaxID=1817883 RepID=A0A1F7SI65_9BACT|nr:MAG: recombinase RecD [Candidatus Schekmanbacteria bacterium GWA2_38_9]OGL50770.1 MAG: recombinase RecD [Candidatus Schekmanbacteria bacterium RIFCSPLOWO2_02_FULL_38_14]OGL53470.1 MAG: recombinase RecD [Candidatus Schekmanbacteria bacterium RIFCSPLOWO2_12_FULL_38_15]OGL54965.1 MAG: recombinase RecD [Candidatus Schekmanbacteria bacterium RIFCSPHIGHO2_02_FULL_38_11]
MKERLTTVEGIIERVVYTSEEDNYTVARVKLSDEYKIITVVGNLFGANLGETLKLTGEWVNHKKFGEQFKIESYVPVIPATTNGIEKYLGSGLIKGVGPVMAKRVVKKFGLNTLDIIENDIESLKKVEGIGKKRIEMIACAWNEQKGVRDVMIFLQSNGVSPAYSAKIFKTYKNQSISIVKNNPYRLATDIVGIGFKIADQIAQNMGIEKNSIERAKAGVVFVLKELAEDGHVCYPYEELKNECCKLLETEADVIESALGELERTKNVFIERRSEYGEEKQEAMVYLLHFYMAESGVAEKIADLLRTPFEREIKDIEHELSNAQKGLNIKLADDQVKAIKNAVSEKVLIITGGPGTGKTTIIRSILGIYEKFGIRVILAAPTGRAAKRLSESTGREAKTIHRLLEYNPQKGGFGKNENSKLKTDMVVVDESSMVDIHLMYNLLKAIPETSKLILVGDIHQLPSVGAGNVLKDIINSGKAVVVHLKEIFRQAAGSMIIVNAHRINQGKFPIIPKNESGRLFDFYFIEEEDGEKIVKIIKELCVERIPERFKFNPIDDIQVLSPMHKGITGASNLNHELQEALNPGGVEFARGGRVFRINDKVMQVRNNYDKDVYNGDIGRVVEIDFEKQELKVLYDTGIVGYDFSELDEIYLSYAISVHKSQGSEYKAVIIPLLPQHYFLLQRNLLYTAVTRGKRLVILVGTKKAIGMALSNNKVQERYTLLRQRLIKH